MNIIGDVAGRFTELMKLVDMMPKEEFLFVGDLNDRGRQSKEVIEWVKSNAKCLQSNHGDFMVDYYYQKEEYSESNWFDNGGIQTLVSYGVPLTTSPQRWSLRHA